MKTSREIFETARDRVRKHLNQWNDTLRDFPDLFDELEIQEIEPRFNNNDGCVDVSINGDANKLRAIWKQLRAAGYVPSSRPGPDDKASFSCFWEPGDKATYAPVWLNFHSTVCKTVQVGTKMVEQPIYEIQCDGPALDNLEG